MLSKGLVTQRLFEDLPKIGLKSADEITSLDYKKLVLYSKPSQLFVRVTDFEDECFKLSLVLVDPDSKIAGSLGTTHLALARNHCL